MSDLRRPIGEVLNILDAEAILILTYEFQAESLVQLFGNLQDPRTHHAIQRASPIVIYDATVSKSHQRFHNALNVHPISIRGGIHHSKGWLKITADGIELVLGSFNSTRFGLNQNRELFRRFAWTKESAQDSQIINDFFNLFLSSVSDRVDAEGYAYLKSFIKRYQATASALQSSTKPKAFLLTNGYEEATGLSKLKQIWAADQGEATAHSMIAVSPFFDSDPRRHLLDRLAEQGLIGSATQLSLVTAANRSGFLPLLTDYVNKWTLYKSPRLIIASEKVDPETDEWAEIASDALSRTNEKLKKENVIHRPLHGKSIILSRGNRSLVYIGSANFTYNAWLHKNKEIGFCEWLDMPAGKILEILSLGLNANELEKWSDGNWAAVLENLNDDDDVQDLKGYPYFLKSARLDRVDDHHVQFKFEVDDVGAEFENYDVSWDNLPIGTIGASEDGLFCGAPLSLKTNAKLLLERSLQFKLKADPSAVFFYSFQLHESLKLKRTLAEFKDSNDWIQSFLDPEKIYADIDGGSTAEDEALEEDERDSISLRIIDRDQNRTIVMQRYLTAYLKMEEKVIREAKDSDADQIKYPEQKRLLFLETDPRSFVSYLRILDDELKNAGSRYAESIFKIGEARSVLVKLGKELTVDHFLKQVESEIAFIDNSIKMFLSKRPNLRGLPMLKEYIKLIRAKGLDVA